MRTLLFFIGYIYLLFSPTLNQSLFSQQPKIKVDCLQKGSFNLPKIGINNFGADSIYYFLIDFILVNNSDSSCRFLTYRCTTALNLVTDNKEIEICINNCASNKLTTIILQSGQKFSVQVLIKVKREYTRDKVKLGWIFIQESFENIDGFSKVLDQNRKNLNNVIWSDKVLLKKTDGQPYEISQKYN